LQAGKKYTKEQLMQAVKDFSDVDYLLKSGRARELDALERCIFRHF